jgi:ATP-binding cassette subfamily B protein
MFENIAYGDWERLRNDRAAVARLAELTGVARIAARLPQGLDTMLGREFSAHDLSGGQWQRVAITRALAHPARLLILDEPTSNIDARAEHDLFAAVAEVARDRTTIIISHRFSTLRIADRILVMDQGRIVEEGDHEALLAAGGYYAVLYRLHERFRI